MKLLVVIAILVVACGGTVAPESPSPIATGTTVYDRLADLTVGQCFDPIRDKDDRIVLAVSVRACDEAHLAELITQQDLPHSEGTPYPGDQQLADLSFNECRSGFKEHVGIDYDQSRLEVEYSYPGSVTWPGGDRHVTCYVLATEIAPFTRSVKGSLQ